MEEKILLSIYDSFQQWADSKATACQKGCATCCTQNVTITVPEAKLILDHFLKLGQEDKLAKILASKRQPATIKMTSNDFAQACQNGEEVEIEQNNNLEPCLFLENNICSIYEVRPFACRAFSSNITCKTEQVATMSEAHTASLTAVYQIIEHLGQRKFWGNFYDVLIAMTKNPIYEKFGVILTNQTIIEAQKRLLKAKPLAGFILSDSDMVEAEPLLKKIFSAKIDGKTIENILNGK